MTHEEIVLMATTAGFESGWVEVCNVLPEIEALIVLAKAQEREACAKLCEAQAGPQLDFPDEASNARDAMAFECADVIRARK
jgi:hypothetical protein